MTPHLLLIALGPVQEFIAQARRTRDLWYGSHLLSELARAAARELADGGADLIFPALANGDPELAPCLAPLRPSGKPPRNIANKLLAEVPAGVEPEGLARRTREAVLEFWRTKVAAPVKQRCAGLLAPGIDPVWDEQIDTFVEFTAAWVPLGDDYAAALRRVEEAVAARKSLRDFEPWRNQRGSVPKSSLDGARESVLAEPAKRDLALVRKYRIADGEQLDAVGLVKRAGGNPGQFVPVINVALASWTKLAADHAHRALEALKRACAEAGISRVDRDLPCVQAFPFDASVFLRSRWRPVFAEQGVIGNPQEWGSEYVEPLLKALGDPYPYVACLVADGDHVGRTIDSLADAERHRAFSEAVASFAGDARQIIEQEHLGILIYSGGDDALGFLPLPEALACADKLRRRFSKIVARVCGDIPEPTLSIGLGLGHVMESMGELLQLGREAETLAKRARNALGIVVDKRSGGRRVWSERWESDPVKRLRQDAEVLEMRLSSRKIYEIATALRRLPRPETVGSGSAWARVLASEVRRSLSRVGEGAVEPDEVGLTLDDGAPYADLHGNVSGWIDRMLIATTFARAVPKPRGPAAGVEV